MASSGGEESDAMDLSDGSSTVEQTAPSTHNTSKATREMQLQVVEKRRNVDSIESAITHKKRKKTPASLDRLPFAVLQRIMIFMPPATLMRCLRVNKKFRTLLTSTKAMRLRGSVAQVADSESIWMNARRMTYPSLPRPLLSSAEAQMIRLVTAQRCKNCGKLGDHARATSALNGGPGARGVRPIWQFGFASCGECLSLLCVPDLELLKEHRELPPGQLRRGLAYALVTKDMHIVSEQVARSNPNLGIVKIFSRAGLDHIMDEYKEARELGDGAADEWVKGLDDMGKRAMSDALRWQRWEEQLPLGTHLPSLMRDLDPTSFADDAQGKQMLAASQVGHGKVFEHPLPKPIQVTTLEQHISKPTQSATQVRPRDHQDILRSRREDIIRRCGEMVPPLAADALDYMPAFRGSMLIHMAMTDAAWEVLRPRLEREREAGERMAYEASKLAYEKSLNAAAINAVAAGPLRYAGPQHQNRDVDPAWERERAPLRAKLAEFADDIIHSKWMRADDLNAHSMPFYASEVLCGVFKKHEQAIEHDSATPSLVLDDLKWIFDSKIRTMAEDKRRELFLCSGCYAQEEERWFAFEGLIQHYGAKHTTGFSKGNIVVHWQSAAWPSEQPFCTPSELSSIVKTKAANKVGKTRTNNNTPRQASLFQSTPHPIYDAQTSERTAKAAADALDVWQQLSGVPDMLDVIRVYATVQNTRLRYGDKFSTYLPVDIFIRALRFASGPSANELRNISKLKCGLCEPSSVVLPEYAERLAGKQDYNLLDLLNHFEIVHLSQPSTPRAWCEFFDLPASLQVVQLMKSIGMNDKKLALLVKAYPKTFPYPIPRIGEVKEPEPDSGLAARLVSKKLGIKVNKSKKKKHAQAQNGEETRSDGEYDPNNPMLSDSQKTTEVDLSQFDTDARKSPPPRMASETLAAINNLSLALAAPQAQPGPESISDVSPPMSPFAQPRRALDHVQPSAIPSSSLASASVTAPPMGTVDFQAILAALAGKTSATGTTGTIDAVASQLPPTHQTSQYLSAPTNTSPQNLAASNPSAYLEYQAAAAPPSWPVPLPSQYAPQQPPKYHQVTAPQQQMTGQDLLAALSQNSRSHAQAQSYYDAGRVPQMPQYQQYAQPGVLYPQVAAQQPAAQQPSMPLPSQYRYEDAYSYGQHLQQQPYLPAGMMPQMTQPQLRQPAPPVVYINEFGERVQVFPAPQYRG